jgi:hypothetical protein
MSLDANENGTVATEVAEDDEEEAILTVGTRVYAGLAVRRGVNLDTKA